MVICSLRTGLLAAGLLVAAVPARAQVPKLTLAEAIERANRVQPSVVQAFGTVRNAQARQRAATGAFFPNLTLSGSGGDNFSEGSRLDPNTQQLTTSGTTNRSMSGTLSSTLNLFTGFRRGAERRAAGANSNAAEAGLTNAQFSLQLTITNQFFDVLAAEQLLTVRQASVRRAEQQLAVSVALLHSGRGIRPDSLRSVVTLGNAQLQLITAQAALATAEANLGRLVGAEGPMGAVDDSTLYAIMPAVDSTALRSDAIEQAPSVRSAQATAVSARAAIAASRASYFPTLNLGGSYSMNGSQASPSGLQLPGKFFKQHSLNLSLNWNIFDRFAREQNVITAEVAAENAEASAGEARRLVVASLTADFAALESARLRIDISRTSVLAATEDLRVQQERYRLGAGTIVDVLTSQEALNQAEVDAVTARFDYVRARAAISALIGRPL